MAPAGTPEPRTIGPTGPTGTLGPDVYRRRRKAVMDKLKTGATLIVNEAHFDGLREGMDFYRGPRAPGAAVDEDLDRPSVSGSIHVQRFDRCGPVGRALRCAEPRAHVIAQHGFGSWLASCAAVDHGLIM